MKEEKTLIAGRRIADDDVYLNENRYEKPKELFKVLGRHISDANFRHGATLLDAGCATGEFLYYIRKILPDFGPFSGMDISEKMVEHARKHVPGIEFSVGSILDEEFFKNRHYDLITCIGTIFIFDDFEKPIKNLLSCVQKGGRVLISGIFNDDPIDVIMRYRRADSRGLAWEKGWNVLSCHTAENILKNSGHQIEWTWHPFRLPFALKKRPEDPMRQWTVSTEHDPFQQVNGAGQIVNTKILNIRMIEPKL